MTNGNDPRLKQDKIERKDKENSNAGMIAAAIIVILGIAGIFLYYNYPTQTHPVTQTTVPNTTPSPTNNNAPATSVTQTQSTSQT